MKSFRVRRRPARPALAMILTILTASSCSFFGPSRKVAISLPALPGSLHALFPAIEYNLTWTAGDGSTRHLLVDPRRAAGSTSTNRRTISVPKGGNGVVLAFPMADGATNRLLPAGAVFPYDLSTDGILALTWGHGFAAELLSSLAQRGKASAVGNQFNARRFIDESDRRSGGDPWQLDRERVLRGVASGAFRATLIRVADQLQIAVPVPESAAFSSLVPADPLAPPVSRGADGTVPLSLAVGTYSYFARDSSARVDVTVRPSGRFSSIILPLR